MTYIWRDEYWRSGRIDPTIRIFASKNDAIAALNASIREHYGNCDAEYVAMAELDIKDVHDAWSDESGVSWDDASGDYYIKVEPMKVESMKAKKENSA
jgi:hypothetical protein